MATAAEPGYHRKGAWSSHLIDNLEEQKDEVLALQSIFESEENRLTVFSSAPEEISENESKENSRLFQLQLQVPVKQEIHKVTLDILYASPRFNTNIRTRVGSTRIPGLVGQLQTIRLRYSAEEEAFQFQRSEHECCVCFMEVPRH
ncbi:uncharacterized protein [Argopecten irradians]|uniref:uncharacterized protein n=1 Tax=Argopecten irradians TaxID=31199 RepID=UPI003713E9DD